jgi:hypothetical protein
MRFHSFLSPCYDDITTRINARIGEDEWQKSGATDATLRPDRARSVRLGIVQAFAEFPAVTGN